MSPGKKFDMKQRFNSILLGLLLGVTSWGRPAVAAEPSIPAGPDGVVQLDARTAQIHGKTAQFMPGTPPAIGYWTDPADYLSWTVAFAQPGRYEVELDYACAPGSARSLFAIGVGGQSLVSRIMDDSGSWYDYQIADLGVLQVDQAGAQTLTLKPSQKPGQAVMNLAWLRLIPVADYSAYLGRTAADHRPLPVQLPAQVFVCTSEVSRMNSKADETMLVVVHVGVPSTEKT